jgi:hypothetical protein
MKEKKYPYQNLSLKDMKGEEWEDVPGLDGAYLISNYGRIKSLRRWVENPAKGGHWKRELIISVKPHVQIVSKGKRKIMRLASTVKYEKKPYSISIARVVYCLFVKKFDLYDRCIFISYKNEDPLDIRPANLLFTNPSASISKAYRKNHRDRDSFGNLAIAVTQYDTNGKKISTYSSISEASQIAGISCGHICEAVHDKDHFASGYIWYPGIKNEERVKLSDSVKKKLASKKLLNTCVTQYDLTGRRIKLHSNIKMAALSVKAQAYFIKLAVLGKAFTVKGFYWKLGKGPAKLDLSHVPDMKLEKMRKSLCRPVTQFDLQGNRIRSYPSTADAARSVNTSHMNIYDALTKDSNTCMGFIWRYGEGLKKIKVPEALRHRLELKKIYAQPVTQYDLDGNRIAVFPDFHVAAMKLKFSKYFLAYTAGGASLTNHGYCWRLGNGAPKINVDHLADVGKKRLLKIAKPVIQYDLNGNKIKKYSSLSEAERTTKISASYIGAAAAGKFKSAKGYCWKFI